MEGFKRGLGYLYISLLIHSYFIMLFFVTVDKNLLDILLHPKNYQAVTEDSKKKDEKVIENIIVETITSSKEIPKEGKISDKANVNSGKKGDENLYNYFNENPVSTSLMKKSGAKPEQAKDTKSEGIQIEKTQTDTGASQTEITNESPNLVGDYHTSYFDPNKQSDVVMDTMGDLSLATIPTAYASYFLSMQKIIGEKWQTFFPVFQYYQGIIKSGDVVVHFKIVSRW